jgi:hypothetical protein
MQNKLIRKPKQSTDSSSVTQMEIPKHLPQTVRAVAESLAIRDCESARRYLEAHLEQKSQTKRDS